MAASSHPARAALLSDGVLTGTAEHDRTGLAAAVQALGGELSVGVDADRLLVSGNVLATNLRALLALVAGVLETATYPAAEVGTERDRLVEKLTIARSQPGVIAAEALSAADVGRSPVRARAARSRGRRRDDRGAAAPAARDLVRPDGATLVLVGDVSPARALDQVESALGSWTGSPPRRRVPPLPEPEPGPLLIVDRPGSVQSSLRMGASALARVDDRYPALQLANLIFGGYFSSRWTENIREDKGYTYGPHSRIDHHVLGSTLLLRRRGRDRGDRARALLETPLRARPDRVVAGHRRPRSTPCASTRSAPSRCRPRRSPDSPRRCPRSPALGLGLDWLIEHPTQLSAVTRRRRERGSRRVLRAGPAHAVVVGDAAAITAPLAALGPGRDADAERSAVDRPLSDGPILAPRRVRPVAARRTDEHWLADAWSRARVMAISPKSATPVTADGRIDRLPGGYGRPGRRDAAVPRRWSTDELYFAATIEPRRSGAWQTLREIGRTRRRPATPALVVSAIALEQWHQRHTHCPRCGAPTVESQPAGHAALHGRRQRALPAHRSRGDHAGRTTAATGRCSAAGTSGGGPVLHARRIRRAGGVAGGRRAREVLRGGRRAGRRHPLRRQPAVAVPGVSHARVQRPPRRRPGDHLDPVEMAEAGWFTRDEVAGPRTGSTPTSRPTPAFACKASPRSCRSRRYLIDLWLAGQI